MERKRARRVASLEVMDKYREVETCCEYMEEHRSNNGDYKKWTQTEVPKVRVLDGLNLYCKAKFVNMIAHGLVDCGAGINLISRKFIGKLVRNHQREEE